MTDMVPPGEEVEYPLILNPAFLRPMPEDMWGMACARCDRVQARWEFHEQVQVEGGFKAREAFMPMCSLCFLYESSWGQRRRVRLNNLIAEIEASIGTPFLMDPGGRLASASDGDRVLAAISLSSRFAFGMTEDIMAGQARD